MSTVNEQLATLSTLSTLSPEEKRVLLAQLLVKKAGQPGTAPISFAQERMWLVERLNPGSSALNLPVSFRIQGPLDRVALERSLNEIVRRHGTLRTSFVEVDGQLQQVVAPSLNLSVQVGDVAHLTTAEREAEIERLVLATTLHPFDLAQAPLMRAILIRVGADEYLLHLVLHHIVCDGWSITILARELDTFYNAFSTGQPVSLPKLPVQYADFARWQREQMQGETLTKQLDYWRQQLKDSPPLLALPTDHSRPPVRTFRDEHIQAMLAVDLVKMLRGISQQEGATLFMTLLAAFQLLLSRYSGMLDVPVGTPVAGRVRSELEDLIGVFINNLVLRTDLSGNPTFRELLRRVRTVALEAQANQEVPFEKIVEVLQPERSLSHTPLFQVMFNMFSFGLAHAELRGLQVEVTMPPETGANFDMTLYALERAGQVELMLDYNADLFEHARMAELLDQYQHLLGQISAHPDENIAQYSLLTAKAQRLLPDPAQPLRDAGVPSLQAGLAQVASQHAEKNALVDPYGTWRYHELDELSNQLANALRASGIRSADPVAIYADRSAALVLALLGVAKAGACFVILDPAYPAAQLVERLSAARPKGFIQLDAAGALPAAVIAFLTDHPVACHLDLARTPNEVRECLNEWSTGVSPVSGQTDDLLYIVFTSGSTGKPKGILGEQRSLTHFLQWHNQTFAFTPSDRFSMLSGLGHDPLLRDVFTPLWVGATLCIPAEKDIETPGRLAAWMSEQRITVAHLMPAMSELMTETSSDSANSGSTEQASLRYAFFGGDTLTQRHVTQLRRLAGEVTVVNFYGASETPQAMAYHVIHNHTADDDGAGADRNTIPIGHGIVDVQLLVLNSVRHLAGIAEVGEIYVRTPFLARGYLNDDTLTQQRFIRNPYGQSPGDRLYRTGDLGRYLPDGTIEFLGREDRQVKIRGFRVELGDIEAALDQYPGLRDTVVVAHEEAPGDRQLVAYVVPHGQTPSLRDMRSFLAERLPGYMIPTAFILLEALPLTPNNKVDLRALPVPGAARMALESVYVGPRTPVEEVLVDIWTETLQCGSLGIHDNFFELGGHSLLATQVVSRVRQVFRVELPLRVLFEAPTVAGMAAQVEEALQDTTAANAPPIMPDQRQSPVPLSFSQERMWFIQQLQPDSSAYHIAPAARFKGTLNMQALEYSLAEVVRRHEDLRTVFAIVDGQPAQVIAPPSDLRLQVVDLLQLDVPPAERERRAIALARQEAQQPFDLSRGPMLRATLYRLNDDEHLLLTAMHHIVTDAWSMGIMTREVAALYNAYVTARPALLPDLDVQYADYACWQRQWLRDEVLENQLAYWRNKLAGVTVIELPADRPRPAIQTYHGAIRSFELPDVLLNALRRLSLKKGVTLFMTTLAAFKVLLYRYTGQTDVTVGVPVANRRWLAVENLIGTFVNTLPLRTDLSGNPT
ncbi:MAG: amino acid adenylation domain-containing protein, partial [Chloroflexi bacterium]|nr:amino acid adenylation domain-containing protein [Chloroflexota bacterium]